MTKGSGGKGLREEASARRARVAACVMFAAALVAGGCANLKDTFGTRPGSMGEVPAARLAFRLEPDFPAARLPPALTVDDSAERLPTIQADFDTRRPDDALVRTVAAPDGQRLLALYEAGDTPEGEFRLDLYAADGTFLANIMPANLSGVFPLTPAWSPDGTSISFVARESLDAEATRKRGGETEAGASPTSGLNPTATVMPLIAPVAAYQTEQIYVCNRDGRDLRAVTTREGLIYFDLAWSPDARALSALACKDDEWTAAANEGLAPRGRPRLVALAGGERLLDDRLTSVVPAWSPDATKVATAFETDVVIYDVARDVPTAAMISLREPLIVASRQYDAAQVTGEAKAEERKVGDKGKAGDNNKRDEQVSAAPGESADETVPLSFNPIIRLEWVEPDGMLAQTGFMRIYRNAPPIRRYER